MISRIQEIMSIDKITYFRLSRITGIKKGVLANCLGRNSSSSTLYAYQFQLIERQFPEYSIWLALGYELPDQRQISPSTKYFHIKNSLPDTPAGWNTAHRISTNWKSNHITD